MTSHSIHRSRKQHGHQSTDGNMQVAPAREISPSPKFRDTRRTVKSQSMPLVPAVMQAFSNQNQQKLQSPNQTSQPSPTTSLPLSRRSPPPSAQQPAPPTNLPSPTNQPTTSPQVTPPPHNQQSTQAHNAQFGYPRPMPRSQAPPFLKAYHNSEDKWQVTQEILADFERTDVDQRAPGTSGVAYAGGAGGYTAHFEPESPPKDPVIDRVRSNDLHSPKDTEHRRQQPSVARKPTSPNTPERRESPAFRTSHEPTSEHAASNYSQYKRESYQRAPTPPTASRRSSNATDPTLSSNNRHSPPQGRKPTPDRSLPVQEAEDDQVEPNRGPSPTPPSEVHSEGRPGRQDSGRDSRTAFRTESDTLYEPDSDMRSHGQEDDEGSYTPRSPSVDLQDNSRDSLTSQYNGAVRQQGPIRGKTRGGPSDHIGMRSIDPAIFEPQVRPRDYGQSHRQNSHHQQYDSAAPYVDGYLTEQMTGSGQWQEDINPAISYLHSFMRSPRPGAPVPPTPYTHTAAPSPSPLISGSEWAHKDSPRAIGSPFPFPFSHVPRSRTHSVTPNLALPEANNYSIQVIQEQLSMQWDRYMRNNHANMSDSTLSPSSSPAYPPGYNPWAFLTATRARGSQRMDHNMSLQSSPSHEPVPLPSRDLKRTTRSMNLRKQATHVRAPLHPPPRVESTQPRDTSPEPSSSGEETAGEERCQLSEESHWTDGDDLSDWIMEDAEPDPDDVLELEYHPTFVNNVEKRRRRWETRWDDLIETFQALDRQTDATLVLMAAPPHTTKLHMISSRSIRREPGTHNHQAMATMRSAFRHLASHRRATRSRRPHQLALAERLMMQSGSSMDGSEGSSESREEGLKRALEIAVGSLSAMSKIHEERETRWREEMRRLSDDREHVEMLLKQTLGPGGATSTDNVGRAL